MPEESLKASSEELVKQVVSWGSIAYALGFLVVMLHTWRLGLPVIELIHPIFIWIGLPLATIAFFYRQISAAFHRSSSEIATEAKTGWSLAVDAKSQADADLIAEAIGSLRAFDGFFSLGIGDTLARTAAPLIQQVLSNSLAEIKSKNLNDYELRKRQFRRILGWARLTIAIFRMLNVAGYALLLGISLYVYVWELYPQIPQTLGGGKSRMVSLVVEQGSLPATPSASAAPSAASVPSAEKATEMLSATLLYMTKDAYYIRSKDGRTLSIKADAVKSVVWDSGAK